MPPKEYDLVIIGSGPAGQKAAFCAAKLGKRVALVERNHQIGGVCIHTGTIPSKAMREAVLHLTGLRERALYGDSYAVKDDITMADLLYRSQHVVKCEVDVIRAHMKSNGVKVVWGDAAFLRRSAQPWQAPRSGLDLGIHAHRCASGFSGLDR